MVISPPRRQKLQGELAALWSRYSCSGLFLEFLGVKNQAFHSNLGFLFLSFFVCFDTWSQTQF